MNFSVAVMVTPNVQDPSNLSSLANYHYVLCDSGDKPINLKRGELTIDIEIKCYTSEGVERKQFSKKAQLTGDFTERAVFDIDLDASNQLQEGAVIGRLFLSQETNETKHEFNLIKVSLSILCIISFCWKVG